MRRSQKTLSERGEVFGLELGAFIAQEGALRDYQNYNIATVRKSKLR